MNPTSQEVVEDSDQLRVIADFLENLTGIVETEEERQLCYAVAEDCRVAATNQLQGVKIGHQGETATVNPA